MVDDQIPQQKYAIDLGENETFTFDNGVGVWLKRTNMLLICDHSTEVHATPRAVRAPYTTLSVERQAMRAIQEAYANGEI
jgi:hypothetical protein